MTDQAEHPKTPNAPKLPEAKADAAGQEPGPGGDQAAMSPEELAVHKERAALGCQKSQLTLADYYLSGPLEVRNRWLASTMYFHSGMDGGSPDGLRKHFFLDWNDEAEDFSGLEEFLEKVRAGAAEGDPLALCRWGHLIACGGVPGEPRESGFGLMMAAADAGLAEAAGQLAFLHEYLKVPVADPAALMSLLEKGAGQGDEMCMTGLGLILDKGSIAPRDLPRAQELFQKAAEAGRQEAAYRTHKFREAEERDKDDLPSRIEELRKLVDEGIPGAMFDLGQIYQGGELGEPDYQEARRLFIDSALYGHKDGPTVVGEMHQLGQGVPRSFTEARLWYLRGIETGSPMALYYMAYVTRLGLGSEVDLQAERQRRDAAPASSAERLTDDGPPAPPDFPEAERLLMRAIDEHDFAAAWQLLSDTYRVGGPGLPKSLAKHISFLKKAAELEYPLALRVLGRLHANGEGGVPRSQNKAFSLLKRAAELGDAASMGDTGIMYYYGKGVAQDIQKAVEWLKKGAEKGDLNSQKNLFGIYYNGDLVPKNDALAFKYEEMAAKQGDPKAQRTLGCLYDNGIGVKKDRALAFAWIKKAADQGEAEALRIHRELMAEGTVDLDFKMPPPPEKSGEPVAPAEPGGQKMQRTAKGQKGRGAAKAKGAAKVKSAVKAKNAAKAKEAAERGRALRKAREA